MKSRNSEFVGRKACQSSLAIIVVLCAWPLCASGQQQSQVKVKPAQLELKGFSWSTGSAPPLARGGYYAASFRGGIVLAGGTYWKSGEKLWTGRVDFFEPAQKRWTSWPALPRPLAYGAMVRIGDSLYLLGGTHGDQPHQEIYRFRGERWEQVGETPSLLFYTAAVAVDQRVYLLGGGRSIRDLTQATREVWVADRRDFKWRRLPDIPGPERVIHTAAAIDDTIYVFGGCHLEADQPLQNLDDAYRFDTAKRTWRRIQDAPLAVRAWWAQPSAGVVYLFGGYADRFLDHVYQYDPTRDAYTLVSRLPQALCDTKFLLHSDGKFYGISGEDQMASRFNGTLVGETRDF